MKVRLLVLFLSIFVCAFSGIGQSVVESESSLLINEKTADISLAIESRARRVGTQIELRLLDTDGNERAAFSHAIPIASGKKKYKFAIPIGDIMKTASDEIAWWRLAYRVGDTHGIASLSELLRDDFDLRAAAFQRVVPGESVRVRVRALNPFNEQAVKGVSIKAELVLDLNSDADEDDLKLTGTGRTDRNGFAMIDFKVPAGAKLDGEAEITIIGQKNGVVRKIEEDIEDEGMSGSVVLTTDKPLYQPGQTFNVRALLLDPNNTIVPDYELEFKIEDENDTVVYRQTVNTSAFGIAAITWPIPENAKLGNYNVVVEADDDLREDQLRFKVSRYDLPNFSVTAKADKTYYLPSDTVASITVNADYLFGKPVTSGKVRVVQERERRWNYREQKHDVEEGLVVEGIADAAGTFIARFDLSKDLLELKSNEWRRFEDISFAAYYTDLATNRTEQRRFEIRLTKEPIHIYLIRYALQHPELPLTAYISTFYADGTPALCSVEINDRKNSVARFKTNSLGAGKFEIDIPRANMNGSDYEMRIVARDKKGLIGTFDESFHLDDDDAIQIRTDKAIYKPGEMIEVDLLSSQKTGFVYLDIVRAWAPVDSKVIELRDGKAHIAIPYKPSFRGDLVVAAYTDKEEGRWSNSMRAVRGIVFPEQQNLFISAKFSKDEYRPSEDATVKFSVLDGSRKPVEGAIGLGIFDKAIEERARTDREFGDNTFSRFYRLMGYDRSFGNLSLKDLNELDLSRPIAPEMQLAAEIMLAGNWHLPAVYHSGNLDADAKSLYDALIAKQIKPVAAAIEARFAKDQEHPTDKTSLERILADNGIDFAKLLDPWGQRYTTEFSVNRTQDIFTLKTGGPDKKAGTADDFTVWSNGFNYFTKTGNAVDEAVRAYNARTGSYIRDLPTLVSELARSGLDGSALRDRWGRDYRVSFEVSGRNYLTEISSLGPNGFYEPDLYRGDDFEVWKTHIDYFAQTEREINRILSDSVHLNKKPFPRNEAEFTEMLRDGRLDIASVKDGYGRSVYVVGAVEQSFADKTTIDSGKTSVRALTQELMSFKVRSHGADPGIVSDDVDLANFSGAITEAHKGTGFAKVEVTTTVFSGAKGAIGGTITDANGAVVPGVEVIATDESDESRKFTTNSNDEGKFLLANLPSGRYTLRVPAAYGFQGAVYKSIQVRSQTRVEVNITLEVANTSATVEVTAAAAAAVDQTSSAIAKNVSTKSVTGFKVEFPYDEQTSTPRLREYFPESLVWQPELLTDKKGKAELNFKMADNITRWKMFAIASNKKGKIGLVEKEITAFQSFFVDLDPPKFLTEGDEIHLPTQVRNYTEQRQKVEVTMDKADWFTFLGGENKQRIDVATGASQNAVFGFKALARVKAGKQRVTAIGQSDSDAIEKPVTVRPNGEEIVRTESKVFDSLEKFDINYPSNALPNTQTAELKIYPNLFAHVADSVEGMLSRPYGCGEQTISSTYPNVMILKFVKGDSALRQKAQRYLQKGYERLIGYQVADGGFTYWGGKDTSDVALTAYALRFLNDAKEFVEVDDDVIRRAEDWLIGQQRADGSWTKRYRWESSDDSMRTKLTTTYVARSMAMRSQTPASATTRSARDATLAKALVYLRDRNAEIDEPYALALFGLAALDAGLDETATQIASRLEKMAIVEGSGVYWKLETNTPFYGWGTAGRVETTALVLQLLTRTAKLDSRPASDIASKGLQFLLTKKDRYGVWYSTQTTINVLDAFLALLTNEGPAKPQRIKVTVNGVNISDINLSPDRMEPVTVDLLGKLSPGSNSVEVSSSTNSPLMAQSVATHYIDWRDSQSSNTNVGESRALRLDYKCDKLDAAIMQEVSCSVEAERGGSKGYGMLLAEIGTPPGADVNRESLEAALDSDWSLSRYDILPDRIVLYMWSKAGGTRFNFKFRPRYGINAQTPASIVYDYYNPEAHATVAPLKFQIK